MPAVGSSKPPIMRSVVVLPQPDGPSSEKNSPSRDLERQVVDRDDLVAELLGDPIEPNVRLWQLCQPRVGRRNLAAVRQGSSVAGVSARPMPVSTRRRDAGCNGIGGPCVIFFTDGKAESCEASRPRRRRRAGIRQLPGVATSSVHGVSSIAGGAARRSPRAYQPLNGGPAVGPPFSMSDG